MTTLGVRWELLSLRDRKDNSATNTPGPHLQLVLNVVRQPEELLLPLGLALRVAGQQPLGPRAAPRLPHPLRLRPARGDGHKAEVRC